MPDAVATNGASVAGIDAALLSVVAGVAAAGLAKAGRNTPTAIRVARAARMRVLFIVPPVRIGFRSVRMGFRSVRMGFRAGS